MQHTQPQPQSQQLVSSSMETANLQSVPGGSVDAPPKQVAQAIERLNQAGRLVADIRLGADRILESLFIAAEPHQSNKPLQLLLKEDASIRKHLQDLRSVGKKLEESGVLTESLRSRSNSWGLHMPLVCPDGAVVAYAWKRQLAGQAGASAVDRTRLALKAFTDQKRRYFPQLDGGSNTEPALKKHFGSQLLSESIQDELNVCRTLSDIQARFEKLVPDLKFLTHGRLDWLKRANLLPSLASESSNEATNPTFHTSSKLRSGLQQSVVEDKIAIIELYHPSVFRALVSLHPAGSTDPDAVAFFSSDEGGSYMHACGTSVYHVYKHITEHASKALQYFLGTNAQTALHSLLLWICGYRTLFSKPCSKCGRLLAIDKKLGIILPPVHRPYRQFTINRTGDSGLDGSEAYHVGCSTQGV